MRFLYPTYQVFLTAVVALLLMAVLTPILITFLQRRRVGQVIRVDGPPGHLRKEGTPTMGGLLILLIVGSTYLVLAPRSLFGILAFLSILSFGLLGLVDDYIKVKNSRSLGIRARTKLIWEFLIAVALGVGAVNLAGLSTALAVPFTRWSLPLGDFGFTLSLGQSKIFFPVLYLVLIYIIFTATTNSVNLTDGLDGLAAGTVAICMLAYAGIAFREDLLELAVLAAAVGGACVGFLWYNSYPAEIFMGDTGSLSLGAAISTLAIFTKTELLLVLIGAVYVAEALSVIGQVAVYKWAGHRLFKMAPLHHHFEISGWSETKIMVRFWILCGVAAGAGFAVYFVSTI